jgi:hypothetical protein
LVELHYGLSILTILIAAVLGIVYGGTLYRRGFELTGHVSVRDCPLIPVGLILMVVAHVVTSTVTGRPQLGWALPVPVEYYLSPLLWAAKLFFAAFSMAAIASVGFRQRYPMRVPLALFCVVVLVAIDGLARRAAQPNLAEIRHKEKGGVILQTNGSTCAAATAANIARIYDIDGTEAEMVERLHTSWAGMSPAQLVYGFRALGLSARKVSRINRDLDGVNPPAVLLVAILDEPDAHAVADVGREGDSFVIWNPNGGAQLWDAEKVISRWGGRAIEVELGHLAAP